MFFLYIELSVNCFVYKMICDCKSVKCHETFDNCIILYELFLVAEANELLMLLSSNGYCP